MKRLFSCMALVLLCLSMLIGCQLKLGDQGSETPEYQIKFVVGANTYELSVKEGETPVFHGTTVIPSDNSFSYEFTGWDREFAPATEDTTYTAQYRATALSPNTVTITFVVGTEVYRQQVEIGKVPVFEGSTDRASEGSVSYAFIGWDQELVPANENLTYIAKYSVGTASYPVRYMLDGELLYETEIGYGKKPSLPESVTVPNKAGYRGVIFWGEENPVMGPTELVGTYYKTDAESVRSAYRAKTVAESKDTYNALGAAFLLLLDRSDYTDLILLDHLRAIAEFDFSKASGGELAMLSMILALAKDAELPIDLDHTARELVLLASEDQSPNGAYTYVFLVEYFGSADAVNSVLSESGISLYTYEGYPLTVTKVLFEKALLATYSKAVSNGYVEEGVSYAYMCDNTATPYLGKIGMLSALNDGGASDADLAAIDMAVSTAALLSAKALDITNIAEARPAVFYNVFIGNNDLMYKLSHGYVSYTGVTQHTSTELYAPRIYHYVKALWLLEFGDLAQEDVLPEEDDVGGGTAAVGKEYLYPANQSNANGLTATISGAAHSLADKYFDGLDFLWETTILADDSMASVGLRIRADNTGNRMNIGRLEQNKITIVTTELIPQNGAPSEVLLGEYGWHRLGIRYHQTTKLQDGEVVYEPIFTFYVDGVKIGDYLGNVNTFTSKGYLLHTATVEDGALSYSAPNKVYYQLYSGTFYNVANSAYLIAMKDTLTSAGTDFVRNVRPLGYETGAGDFKANAKLSVVVSEGYPTSYDICDVMHFYNVDEREYFLLSTPDRAGYTFLGWYDTESGEGERYVVYDPFSAFPGKLYARYEQISALYTFDAIGGELSEDEIWISLSDRTYTLPTPTPMENGTFLGWYFDDAFTVTELDGRRIEDGVLYIDEGVTEGVTLYAKIQPPKGTVTMDYRVSLDGASLPETYVTGLTAADFGSTVTLPTLTVPSGYLFLGWYASESFDGAPVSSFVYTEAMSEGVTALTYYARCEKVLASKKETDHQNPNLFYAVIQSKNKDTVDFAKRPYISYEFDFTANACGFNMNFGLRTQGQLPFLNISNAGELSLSTNTFAEAIVIGNTGDGEHRIAIVLYQGDEVIDNGNGTYGTRYYFDMTVYLDGESLGTYRTKEDAAFVSGSYNFLFYEATYTSLTECTRKTVVHTNDHLYARVYINGGKKPDPDVPSFLNDCYVFHADKPGFVTTVPNETDAE